MSAVDFSRLSLYARRGDTDGPMYRNPATLKEEEGDTVDTYTDQFEYYAQKLAFARLVSAPTKGADSRLSWRLNLNRSTLTSLFDELGAPSGASKSSTKDDYGALVDWYKTLFTPEGPLIKKSVFVNSKIGVKCTATLLEDMMNWARDTLHAFRSVGDIACFIIAMYLKYMEEHSNHPEENPIARPPKDLNLWARLRTIEHFPFSRAYFIKVGSQTLNDEADYLILALFGPSKEKKSDICHKDDWFTRLHADDGENLKAVVDETVSTIRMYVEKILDREFPELPLQYTFLYPGDPTRNETVLLKSRLRRLLANKDLNVDKKEWVGPHGRLSLSGASAKVTDAKRAHPEGVPGGPERKRQSLHLQAPFYAAAVKNAMVDFKSSTMNAEEYKHSRIPSPPPRGPTANSTNPTPLNAQPVPLSVGSFTNPDIDIESVMIHSNKVTNGEDIIELSTTVLRSFISQFGLVCTVPQDSFFGAVVHIFKMGGETYLILAPIHGTNGEMDTGKTVKQLKDCPFMPMIVSDTWLNKQENKGLTIKVHRGNSHAI
jgi:hypothetical protein